MKANQQSEVSTTRGDYPSRQYADEALSGEITPGCRAFIETVVLRLAGKWWGEQPILISELVRKVCVHLEGFQTASGVGKLDFVVEEVRETEWADGVLDPLVRQVIDLLPGQDEDVRGVVFVRCFLLEIVLVEAFRLERLYPDLRTHWTDLLYEFIQRKARPFAGKRLLPTDADDAVAQVALGLLGYDPIKWRRKTLLDFMRNESSLAAFVVNSTRFQVLDALQEIEGREEVGLDDQVSLETNTRRDDQVSALDPAYTVAPKIGEDARAESDIPEVDTVLNAVLSSGRKAPHVLDPATPVGRRRLALIEAFLQSHLVDEQHGTHTCIEGTPQQKYVYDQGSLPCMVTGCLGGNRRHPRFDDTDNPVVADRGDVIHRGFNPDTCHTYTPKAGSKDEGWLHWRVLYTLAFFSIMSREGLLPVGGPVFRCAASRRTGGYPMDKAGIRHWCVRKRKDEPVPTEEQVHRALAEYHEWLGTVPQAAAFSAQPDNGTIRSSHAYPHVLLSSYAQNAFRSLFAGYRMAVPLSIDDLRTAMKDLVAALQKKGVTHGREL